MSYQASAQQQPPSQPRSSRHRVTSLMNPIGSSHAALGPSNSVSRFGQQPGSQRSQLPSASTSTVVGSPLSVASRYRTLSTTSRPANPPASSQEDEGRRGANASTAPRLPSSSSSSAIANLSPRRGSWTAQRASNTAATNSSDYGLSSSTSQRPSTASRIPSLSRGNLGSSRLGDALLGQRKPSEAAIDSRMTRSGLTSSTSSSGLAFPARRESLARGYQAELGTGSTSMTPSGSNASLSTSTSLSSMGPPTTTFVSHSGSSESRSTSGTFRQGGFLSISSTTNESGKRIRESPSLPSFDESISAPLFNDDILTGRLGSSDLVSQSEKDSQETSLATTATTTTTTTTTTATATANTGGAPTHVAGLPRSKPKMHLALRESPQMSSRFSNFSSALGTPDSNDDFGKMLRKNSVLSSSNASTPVETSVSAIEPSMAGLGIGLPSSMQAASSRPSAGSAMATSAPSAPASALKSTAAMPQTPDKFGDYLTPVSTPMAYDRAGQIGIGELATPRWNFPAHKISQWSSSPKLDGHSASLPRSVSNAISEDGSVLESQAVTRSKPRGPSGNSAIELSEYRKAGAEESKHSRSISYSALSSSVRQIGSSLPEESFKMTLSPSMPFHQTVTEASSKRTLEKKLDEISSTDQVRELADRRGSQGGTLESSSKSVGAPTERKSSVAQDAVNDSDLLDTSVREVSALAASLIIGPNGVQSKSPGIGDLSWAEGETGPFGGDASMDEGDRSSKWRDSFDLNTAITELLNEHDARRRERTISGQKYSDGSDSSRKNSTEVLLTSPAARIRPLQEGGFSSTLKIDKAAASAAQLFTSADASSMSTRRDTQHGGARGSSEVRESQRRSRHTSSSGQAQATTSKTASRISSVPTASASRSKRTSSASIGQSLLRGSMPFPPGEEFESILYATDDAAADALRKLDGLGGTPRTSKDFSKSPRGSKQISRPGSSGRSASRASSPSSKPARFSAFDSPSARTERQRSEDSMGKGTARTSRNFSRAKGADEPGSTPSSSIDSPRTSSFSSPRTRRSQLPPMPQTDLSVLQSGTSMLQGSKRSSIASVSGRDSYSSTLHSTSSVGSRAASKSKRTSALNEGALNLSGDASFLRADMIGGQAEENDQSQRQVSIPPVPPLPKVWESSRAGSFLSDANTSAHHSPVLPSASTTQPAQEEPCTPGTPLGPSDSTKDSVVPSKKWSFPSLPSALTRSPSSVGKNRNVTAPVVPESGEHQRKAQNDESTRRSRLSTSASDISVVSSAVSRGVGSVHETPRRQEAAAAVNGAPSSPRMRRTPSFFSKTPKKVVESGGTSSDVASDDKSFTAPSGRLSRKSIMGLGSLLGRSSSRKTVNANEADSGNKTPNGGFPPKVSHPPSAHRAETARRTSLIGRKRGKVSTASGGVTVDESFSLAQGLTSAPCSPNRTKTLPSSNEAPKVTPVSLPPREVSRIPDSPALAKTKHANLGQGEQRFAQGDHAPAPRRQLNNSISAQDLSAKAGAPGANVKVSEGEERNLLPTIDASPSLPPTETSTTDYSEFGMDSSTVSKASGQTSFSRIPRVIAVKTASRIPTSSSGTNLASSTSSQPSIRAVGSTSSSGNNLATSKSLANSLAANFGIGGSDDEGTSVSGSDLTAGTTRRSSQSQSSRPPPSPSVASRSANSSSLVSILNAYAAAKTSAEVESVLRRARIASYSASLSASEREVLNSLSNRHEQRKADAGGTASITNSPAPKAKISEAVTPRAAKVLTSSVSSAAGLVTKDSPSAPARKARVSVTTSSASARAARDASLNAANRAVRASVSPLLSLSPALSETGSNVSSNGASTSPIEEEERLGDSEMEAYIKRQQNKKLAAGATQEELDKMLQFPEPEPPSRMLSPRQAEVMYGNKLSPFEMQEMYEFREIFYCGQKATKKHQAVPEKPNNNHGYDDERGDYLVTSRDHLAYRYEIVDLLGRGSFGQVLQCRDHKTGKTVAIKLIRNKKRFHHQALVEVKILENLTKWDPDEQFNVIKMTESFYFRNHLCIATELLSINLYELIKANNFAGFSTRLIRRFTTQMLASLSLMKHHRIVHCDLKPENILLKHPRKSGIKVIDFGSSCFEHEKVYTYIQSRFYRSPEVILGMNYHTAIDIWSLGCIIAELYTGYPLFPGENEQEQLACIMEILGTPERYLIDRSSRKKLFFDSTGAPRPVVNSKGKRRRPGTKTLAQALKSNDDLFIDFIAKCLVWDPERRLKPDPAMRHPWILQGRRQAALAEGAMSMSRLTSSSGSTNGGAVPLMVPRKSTGTTSTPRSKATSSSSTVTSVSRSTTSGNLAQAMSPRRASNVGMATTATPIRAPRA
ncbi:hypothetical protein IE53DRAFT_61194 [Violaceomyces palustris]|uniref:Uncharacterized protein n=1 Tax=Violaceomyces palustris TaxID=1673888 RepID=A0ACD0NZL5_9BASI|nr:hypothetical protein IE53DRAFT_61194 [Violaceomyces palustris]